MAKVKIDYGIDLGTTNSAIARMENGDVKIIKSDTQKDTTPSCVYFRKNAVLVGDTAYARYGDEHKEATKEFSHSGNQQMEFNTFIEFKRTMGTDKRYESKNAGRSFNSEELSAEVLKALKNYVRDDELSAVVITVPARFRNNQVDATQKAAELSGFSYCELLMEPIAASIAYGVNAKTTNGYWLVFDFGGGTFDAALMKVEEAIMKVVDTDGDNHLGGKDLDYAVVDNLILPYLQQHYKLDKILENDFGKRELREALKTMAEEAKIAISPPSKTSADIYTNKPLGEDDDGKEIDFEMKMTIEEYEKAVSPVFQRAIDISAKLIEKNNLDSADLQMVLLVGGPTLSQTLRKMLKEQLKTKIDTSIDPMTSVAVGAAFFAATKDIPNPFQKRDKQKIQLILRYPNNTVETEENLVIRIDREQTKGAIPSKIFVEISRKDKGWSSGMVEISGDSEIISLLLSAGKSNGFEIKLADEKGDAYPTEPTSFNIVQGFTPPPATLSFHLGIEAFVGDSEKPMFLDLQGLSKNQSLPAKGKGIFKTQKDIRPGNAQDRIWIPIYEGEPKTRALFNEFAGVVTITGDDLPKFLPSGSEVQITLEVNNSRGIYFKAYFPDIDETVERRIEKTTQSEYDADQMEREIESSLSTLSRLEGNNGAIPEFKKIRAELDELKGLLANGKRDYEIKTKVMERLRLALIALDKIEAAEEFPRISAALIEALRVLSETIELYGTSQNTKDLEQFQILANDALKNENITSAKELALQIGDYDYAILDKALGVEMDISNIKAFDRNFDAYTWKNKTRARQLITEANLIMDKNPTREKLNPLVLDLCKLLPVAEQPKSGKYSEYLRPKFP